MHTSLIDIGSNTVKLAVYSNGSPKPIFFCSEQIGLADYVKQSGQERTMENDGIGVLQNVLEKMKKLALEKGYPKPIAFCTAACRDLSNEATLINAIEKVLQSAPRILTGEQEALYTLRGVISSVPISSGLMIDMGGASTEFCLFENNLPLSHPISIPCGCRHLYKCFSESRSLESVLHLFNSRATLPSFPSSLSVCLSGGSAKALDNVLKSDQFPAEIKKDIPTLISYLLPILKNAVGYEDFLCRGAFGNRYPLMLPSLYVFSSLLERLSPKEVFISHGGTREGYYLSMLSK